jgi:hypothetical protein
MSFVARPPILCPPDQPPAADRPIVNDGFFPDVDPLTVREAARIPGTVTPPRLREAILGAILTVGRDLAAWADGQRAAGFTTLADVPAATLDGTSHLALHYQRAVALHAKAELIARLRDFDTTAAGGKQVDELGETIGDLRRDARHAVRDILGTTRTLVDLI